MSRQVADGEAKCKQRRAWFRFKSVNFRHLAAVSWSWQADFVSSFNWLKKLFVAL